ncbi:hypothetical protein ACJX0J_014798 [Zea mays]
MSAIDLTGEKLLQTCILEAYLDDNIKEFKACKNLHLDKQQLGHAQLHHLKKLIGTLIQFGTADGTTYVANLGSDDDPVPTIFLNDRLEGANRMTNWKDTTD